jgi:oligopeptide/dipeptide ABC transporter ATP-binding protein
MNESAPLLTVEDLEVSFPGSSGDITVVAGVDLSIRPGEFFGLIGETGAGKSITAWASLGLVPPPGEIRAGVIRFEGRDLLSMEEYELRELRGRDLAAIVQNPRAALNPMATIGSQIANVYLAHHDEPKKSAMERAVESLRAVGIPDPGERAATYPHQLSGGMAQRVLIAMAMINRPKLLIADEPTTGLDVTIQAEILDLMADLVASQGSSVWLITHDLGVIANYTQRAAVMFAGQIVEVADTKTLFDEPMHPYTQGLVQALSEGSEGTASRGGGGDPPDLAARPVGCQYACRCPLVEPECRETMPILETLAPAHDVRCLVASRQTVRSDR